MSRTVPTSMLNRLPSGPGPHVRLLTALSFLLLFLLVAGLGCSGETAEPGAAASDATTLEGAPGNSVPTSEQPLVQFSPKVRALADELERTALATGKLADELEAEQVQAGDPRLGLIYGLRARAQAITARQALMQDQSFMLAEAVKQLRVLLAKARAEAAGDVAAAVSAAESRIDYMGSPSEAETTGWEEALEDITTDLAPLVEAAEAAPPG